MPASTGIHPDPGSPHAQGAGSTPVRGRATSAAWHRSLPRRLAMLALVAAAYYLAGKLGLTLAFVHPSATPVWPPAGITLAVLLRLGHRVWPGVFAGAFLVNVTTAG